MGHHLTDAKRFQSDKPVRVRNVLLGQVPLKAVLGEGLIAVSFNHPEAWAALAILAEGYSTRDPELSDDIWTALETAKREACEPKGPGR